MKATILIKNAVFFARHGVHAEEARLGQRFEVDLEVDANIDANAERDDVTLSVGYDALHTTVEAIVRTRRYYLIEALADAILSTVIAEYPRIMETRIEIRKPGAPIDGAIDYAAVRLTRSRHG